MTFRRSIALLGPLTACGALLLPWYDYGSESARGWDMLNYANWIVIVLALAIAGPVLRAGAASARTASVAGGFGLGVVALHGMLDPVGPSIGIGSGLWLTLAAGVATIAGGARTDVAVWRRLLALLGPVTTIVALSLPWWIVTEATLPFTVTGWDTLNGSDWALAGLGLAAAAAAVGAPREHARAACLACGTALVTVAGWGLMFGTDELWDAGMAMTGPVVAIAGGLATTIAGLVLYPARRSASSLITAS
jgi:hypothetical protein